MMISEEALRKLPSPEDLFLKTALYKEFDISEDEDEIVKLAEIVLFDGYIDVYCIDCQQASVFRFISPYQSSLYPTKQAQFKGIIQKSVTTNQTFSLTANCSRDKDHKLFFYFVLKNNKLSKVGQYPSIADLYAPDLKKYRKVLGPSNFADLRRAIGLKAHGLGAGSLIYLRRIFENLIEDAHNDAINTSSWDEGQYFRSRMEEKIQLLAQYLPQALVELRGLYGIMSKGVHSLSEDECLMYFEPVRVGIELILEEKIAKLQELEKQKKEQEAKNLLLQIKSKINP